MLTPDQFTVNDAWLVFQLNTTPIDIVGNGSFNAICLMDAASCFILGHALLPAPHNDVRNASPELQVRHLFETALGHARQFPTTLFVSEVPFDTVLRAEAARNGVSVVTVAESELSVFTQQARQGFNAHFP